MSTGLKQCAVYADDILMLARAKHAMIDAFNKLKIESIKYGLVINEKKIKYMNAPEEYNLKLRT
jgi:hypothetical protein